MLNLLFCLLKYVIICFICFENINLFGLKDVNVFLFIFLGVIDKNGFYKSKDLNSIIYFFFYLDGML